MRWEKRRSEDGDDMFLSSDVWLESWKEYEREVLGYHSDPTFTADGDESKL